MDQSADAGLPCRAHRELEAALRGRLPGLRVEQAAGEPGPDDLQALLTRRGGSWQLELRRSGGALALQRLLALPAGDCPLLGETAALIVDRFLAQVRWAGRPAPLEPLPPAADLSPLPTPAPPPAPLAGLPPPPPPLPSPLPPPSLPPPPLPTPSAPPPPTPTPTPTPTPPPPPPPPPPLPPTLTPSPPPTPPPSPSLPPTPPPSPSLPPTPPPSPSLPPTPPPPPPPPSHLTLWLGSGAWAGLPGDLRFSLQAEATLRRGPGQLSFALHGAAPSSEPVLVAGQARGDILVQQALALASAALCAEPAGFLLCGGPAAGVRLSRGAAEGGLLFRTTSALLAQPEVGLRVELSRRIAGGLEAGVCLVAAAALGSASFAVSGAPARTLRAPDLAAALRLGWGVF